MQIIPVASGKGGVGKSLLSANLGIALGKAGNGTYINVTTKNFNDLITPTDYENVYFIAEDAELPGLTSLKIAQKNDLIKKLQKVDADYLILDLGAGTHLAILDFFLLSPQGIVVTAPTVTATLNGYLFLKNVVFRLMYNSFKKNSKAFDFLENLKKDANSLQKLYIPKLVETLEQIDPQSIAVFKHRMAQFKPRLILNMVDDPRDAEKAQKIRRSCDQYLGVELEHLGIIYRDSMQDIALSSRLPIIVYKPQAMISQAISRIADKVIHSEALSFDDDYDSFQYAEAEANEDYASKMSYVEDLVGTGALSMNDLGETIKSQQYEITQLRKENTLLKSKILKAVQQGFKI